MTENALGLIETVGLPTAIEAADAAMKSAAGTRGVAALGRIESAWN